MLRFGPLVDAETVMLAHITTQTHRIRGYTAAVPELTIGPAVTGLARKRAATRSISSDGGDPGDPGLSTTSY